MSMKPLFLLWHQMAAIKRSTVNRNRQSLQIANGFCKTEQRMPAIVFLMIGFQTMYG
jgi:hypothetical protein